ncbi:MAG: hypothetical protein WC506_00145 [Candidatus Micrarchaeia archaeon]
MEKKVIGIGAGILALAAIIAIGIPAVFAHGGWGMMGYGTGYGNGYGMMGGYGYGYANSTQPHYYAKQAPNDSDGGFYGYMAQAHNSVFGTNYTPDEFYGYMEKMHEYMWGNGTRQDNGWFGRMWNAMSGDDGDGNGFGCG